MSSFIARIISFNKEKTMYRLKGGDNNIIPRLNKWTMWMPLEELYCDWYSRAFVLKDTSDRGYFVRNLFLDSLTRPYSGNYYNDHKKGVSNDHKKEFDAKFLKSLLDGLKKVSNKKEFIIEVLNMGYLKKMNKDFYHTCTSNVDAKRMTYNRAKYLVEHKHKYKYWSVAHLNLGILKK